MAQDIGLDLETDAGDITMPTADVTDTNTTPIFGGVAAAGIDLGTPTPLFVNYEWIQTTLASCVDFIYLQAMWSKDDTDYGDADNAETVAVMQCTASTDKKKIGMFPTRGRYIKFQIENQSGGTLDFTASNSDLTISAGFGDQA